MIIVEDHPTLDLHAFVSEFPRPIGTLRTTPEISELLSLDVKTPMAVDETVKPKVRDLLRQGGAKQPNIGIAVCWNRRVPARLMRN